VSFAASSSNSGSGAAAGAAGAASLGTSDHAEGKAKRDAHDECACVTYGHRVILDGAAGHEMRGARSHSTAIAVARVRDRR
jgi:hypothetical protein